MDEATSPLSFIAYLKNRKRVHCLFDSDCVRIGHRDQLHAWYRSVLLHRELAKAATSNHTDSAGSNMYALDRSLILLSELSSEKTDEMQTWCQPPRSELDWHRVCVA